MSQEHATIHEPNERTGSTDGLAVIREEKSAEHSSVDLYAESSTFVGPINPCICKEPPAHLKHESEQDILAATEIDEEKVQELLKAREEELRAEFEMEMKKEISNLKEKFDFILHNEQVRASVMLREAHRERREKISALQTQLECKNMSGLMYVMCSERKRCLFEKMALTEEYTAYIRALQDILVDAQALILQLSRGYKTAGRVDHEWRTKMKNIIKEFQSFVVHYMGDNKVACQYLFDIPKLLSTKAPVIDDLVEDPCTCEEEEEEGSLADEEGFEEPSWWHTLGADCRPFVMFGDCEELKPTQRRDMLRVLKIAEGKTVPKKWKEYRFNEMFINATCSNVETIKEEYNHFLLTPTKWECRANQTPEQHTSSEDYQKYRNTTTSVDIRGNMGSILKLVTATTNYVPLPAKSLLLAARDSMEIASSTKILHHSIHGGHGHGFGSSANRNKSDAVAIVLDIKKRRHSMLEEEEYMIEEENINVESKVYEEIDPEEEKDDVGASDLASLVNDSLVLMHHKPCEDAKINFEKICPMEKCQRMKVDSFLNSLPPYMRASPFMHFEQTFDEYEPCTPEQLDLLKKRIDKKHKEPHVHCEIEDPLAEWMEVKGFATQTSLESLPDYPPCPCKDPSPTPIEGSDGKVYDSADLFPLKQMVNMVGEACFYDSNIDFNRFHVIGQEPSRERIVTNPPRKFMEKRIDEIKKILKKNPSLLDMFQANTQC